MSKEKPLMHDLQTKSYTTTVQTSHYLYKKTNAIPTIGLNVESPKTTISDKHKQIILDQHAKHHFNALYLENIIEQEEKTKIPYNTIHRIMLKYGLATRRKVNKKSKPWIRYERELSLSNTHELACK